MSDKLPALGNLATPALTDLLYIVTPGIDPLGSFNITYAQLRAALLAGVGVAFPSDITPQGNAAGGALTTLQSFVLPAGSLGSNGDFVRFTYSGTFATNDNDKRIQILIDGQVVEDFGLFDFDAGVWRVTGEHVRLTSTSVLAGCGGQYGEPLVIDEGVLTGTPDVINLPRNRTLAVADLDSNPITLEVVGAAAAANDIIQTLSIYELIQF
jgi:hypothetical protein